MAFSTTEACILEAERLLARPLPTALRQRLLVNNGGEVEFDDDSWQLHPVWDSTSPKTMGRTANHVVRET